jgi:hypothetical protein
MSKTLTAALLTALTLTGALVDGRQPDSKDLSAVEPARVAPGGGAERRRWWS